MDYSSFIDKIVEKYGYEDNMKRAIEIAIPLMVRKYGKSRLDEVLSVFEDVRICPFTERTKEEFDRIQSVMLQGVNPHVKDEETVTYGTEEVAGSTYGYQAIYDEDMNVIGEKRWIAAEEITGPNKEKYEQLFKTNVNIPYLLHELCHAFGMQKANYKKEGNKIYSKHGLYETIDEIDKTEGQTVVRTVQEEGLLVEDVINEKITKDLLMYFFNISSENELSDIISYLGSSGNIYGGTLHFLATQLEEILGAENLLKWRVDNDNTIQNNFSFLCGNTQIANGYFPKEDAYSYLASKIHEIYLNNSLVQNGKLSIEEYKEKNLVALYDAMAPICAYREAIGDIDFAFYDNKRKETLPNEPVPLSENRK